jgi:valyl-tRNA synthetase
MPFVTEEIWQRIGSGTYELKNLKVSIMTAPWPHIQEQLIDKKLEKQALSVFAIITQIRNLRSSLEVMPDKKVKVSLYPHSKIKQKLVKENTVLIKNLAKLEELELLDSNKRPAAAISATVEDIDLYLHFTGLLDVAKEQRKFSEKIHHLSQLRKSKEERLKNPDFIKKAPKDIVDCELESKAKLDDELKRLEKMLDELR